MEGMSRKLIRIVILIILAVLISVINTICLQIILASKRLLRSPTTLLITNFIAIHLIQGVVVLPLYALTQHFRKVVWLHDSYQFMYKLTFYGNCLAVLLLSIDRLLAIKLLTSYFVTVTKSRVKKLIIVCWTYVFVLCLIPFFPSQKSNTALDKMLLIKYNYNAPQVWSIFMLILNTLIPYVVVIGIYVVINQKIHKLVKSSIKRSSVSDKRTSSHDPSHNKESRNALQTTLLVLKLLLCSAITWFPKAVYVVIRCFYPSHLSQDVYGSGFERNILFSVNFVSILNALIAPLIYFFYHKGHRLRFKSIMTFCSGHNGVDPNYWHSSQIR
ncbi:psychosine receptor [Hydra vulgaris]|uniref:Psychosine receptor n=1 Tax=Hydra vulgaris TaxID=6087 RepID=A0ABM4DG86_HYDVU